MPLKSSSTKTWLENTREYMQNEEFIHICVHFVATFSSLCLQPEVFGDGSHFSTLRTSPLFFSSVYNNIVKNYKILHIKFAVRNGGRHPLPWHITILFRLPVNRRVLFLWFPVRASRVEKVWKMHIRGNLSKNTQTCEIKNYSNITARNTFFIYGPTL